MVHVGKYTIYNDFYEYVVLVILRMACVAIEWEFSRHQKSSQWVLADPQWWTFKMNFFKGNVLPSKIIMNHHVLISFAI